MCGILGSLPSVDRNKFTLALATIRHRGPDAQNSWHTENISLGHTRLSILDLSDAGAQPMIDISGRYTIVFNGEIYNFIEIKHELKSKGFAFRSESDTEVVLNAFIEWGPACLDKFNGMWALAIWDQKEKRLFLARDRFGKKPMFYAFIGERFIFASEMKAIFPFLKMIKPSQDYSWMAKNLFLYEATEKCLIDGIKRFPSGHYGFYAQGQLILNRYWNTLDHLPDIPDRYDDQVEVFRELFIDAVKIRMRSDVPVGTALSGGLDSSATISAMAHIGKHPDADRISNDWQHAFVATFSGTPIDERYFAKKVVNHIGIDATYIDIDPLRSWNKLNDILYHFEELYLTSPIPMVETYQAVRKHGTVVTLDGHGADELFSGYGQSLFEAFLDAKWHPTKIRNIFDTYESLWATDNPELTETNQFGKHPARWLQYANFMAKKTSNLWRKREYRSKDASHQHFRQLDHFNRHCYILTHETILPTLLRNYDRYSMMNGVEIRMPFMDHRLVCYAMALPWHSKIKNGYTKNLVRDAVAPFMPIEVAYRKSKIGFNSPVVNWMRGPLKSFFLDTIHSKDFLDSALIDADKVKSSVEHVIYGSAPTWSDGEKAWIQLTPFLWEKSVLKRDYTWN